MQVLLPSYCGILNVSTNTYRGIMKSTFYFLLELAINIYIAFYYFTEISKYAGWWFSFIIILWLLKDTVEAFIKAMNTYR